MISRNFVYKIFDKLFSDFFANFEKIAIFKTNFLEFFTFFRYFFVDNDFSLSPCPYVLTKKSAVLAPALCLMKLCRDFITIRFHTQSVSVNHCPFPTLRGDGRQLFIARWWKEALLKRASANRWAVDARIKCTDRRDRARSFARDWWAEKDPEDE